MEPKSHFIDAKQVHKKFPLPGGRELAAVDDVTVSIAQGSLMVLSGASGSGKSTLLGLLATLARPTSGEIYLDGHELRTCSEMQLAHLRRRIGFVFQSFLLIPKLPVWEGITYGLIPRGWRRAARRAAEVLARLGLADRLDQPPEQLSGGEQQRVAIARALVGDPELIVADEPTSNLDPRSTDDVLALFAALQTQGRTLLIATHDPRLAALATQQATMLHGRLRMIDHS